MQTLFISDLLPETQTQNVFGYAQRANILLQAAARLGSVHLHFYVWGHARASTQAAKVWEEYFSNQLGRSVSVSLHSMFLPTSFMRWKTLSIVTRCLRSGTFTHHASALSVRTAGPNQIRALDKQLANKPDLILVQNVSACVPLLLTKVKLPPIVYDLDGFEFETIEHHSHLQSKLLKKLAYNLTARLVRRTTRKCAALAQRTLVAAKKDCATLESLWQPSGVTYLPNAVDLKPKLQACSMQTLLFIGVFQYPPNKDAIDYFIAQIWPLVLREVPQARLRLVGLKPELISAFSDQPDSIDFLGFVEDIEQVYADSRVVICPLRAGAGTRLKVLEAAAYARPIVSTTLGAFGIELRDGTEIFLRDDPHSFAAACVALLQDEELCATMGNAARNQVTRHYDHQHIIDLTVAILEEANQQATPLKTK